jgi:arylsulfatase A-like enzyme
MASRDESHVQDSTHLRRVKSLYDRAVKSVDRQIGRLLDNLAGVERKAAVIVTADHGEEFFEHGKFGHSKGSLYEEIIHVPLIIAWPDGPQGLRIKEPVSLIDVAPTILDRVGIPKPQEMLGRSTLPMINQGNADLESRSPIIAEGRWKSGVHRIAIKVGQYKFIVDLRYPDQYELYDLNKDPEERSNLRGQRPERAAEFRRILSQHLDRVRRTEQANDSAPQVDEEIVDRLRALGYVE